ncbi:hypothetical protein ACIHCV_37000 [Streptomyces sp. NPDC051956]|uniref:hypothetical protein n=1 Tax=Streptomyces sp. NPDC051956 TaxID=3365677 RepID=UPI0037D41553
METCPRTSADKVELRDCVDGSKWVQVKPGSSPDGLTGSRRHTEIPVVRTSTGGWKVSGLY